jgi:hypothetical protein
MSAMTELDMLARRMELVELFASLQRATLARRLAPAPFTFDDP